MLTNVRQHAPDASEKRGDAMTWGTIFGLPTTAVGMLFWMGSASNAGKPLGTVASIGLAFVVLAGLGAIVAVKFSRRP